MNSAVREIGLAGLGGVGRSLALNIADHGYSVAAYDWDEIALGYLRSEINGKDVVVTNSIANFIELLRVPRIVMILLPAGPQVDGVINALLPLLAPGDLVVDAGKSYFKDTDTRSTMLAAKGVGLLGVGISGAPRDARHGTSIMPGGSPQAYDQVRRVLEDIAAEVNGRPCVSYLGPHSAGHYVDMVYCGIQQGIMQLIAETYDLMSRGLGLSDAAIQKVYGHWGDSEVSSSLLGIIAQRLPLNNGNMNQVFLELIAEDAAQNRSGAWASLEARDLGVPMPTIDVAVATQLLSTAEEHRAAFRRPPSRRPIQYVGHPDMLIEQVKRALHASVILTVAQGTALLSVASELYGYGLELAEVARIWRGGSIIPAQIVQGVGDAFYLQPHLSNLLSDSQFAHCVQARREDLRSVLRLASEQCLVAPALTESLAYYDAYQRLGPDDPQVTNHYLMSEFLQEPQKSDGAGRVATPEIATATETPFVEYSREDSHGNSGGLN